MTMQLGSFQPEFTVPREHGEIAIGLVGINKTPVHVYQPYDYSPESGSSDFVAAIGLLARPDSYGFLGETLMEDHDRLIVFGHDHRNHRWPIRANAEDVVRGVHELELERFTAVGHSMGTLVVLLAMENNEFSKSTRRMIQADPAMTGNHLFYKPEDYFNMTREAVVLVARKPKDALQYATGALIETVRRPLVINQQITRLLSGKVHDRYGELMAQHPDVECELIFNRRDGLVPERWGESMRGKNIVVLRHNSRVGVGHSAINVDPDVGHGLHAIDHDEMLPPSFTVVYDGRPTLLAA